MRALTWQEGGTADVADVAVQLGGPPNLVLAADVVYRESTFSALVSTLAALCDSKRSKKPDGSDTDGPAEALFAYRPRVDDKHFFHMLHEEFLLTRLVAPAQAKPLLRNALAADTSSCAPADPSPELAEATGSARSTTSSSDDEISPRGSDALDPSAAAPCMIYRLTRREVRQPCVHCRVCMQRRAASKLLKRPVLGSAGQAG